MPPKSSIKNNAISKIKSTVKFIEKKTNTLEKKPIPNKSNTKIANKSNTKLQGGISVKDDPDKAEKEEYESDIEKDEDEDEDEEEEEEEPEKEEETEKEEFDKEKEEDDENVDNDTDDRCVYKLTKKKNTIDIELDAAEDNFEDDDLKNIEDNVKSIYVKNSDRKTKPFLFDFERVRILGERARQLSLGAKPMIKNIENMNPKVVARLELEKKVIPLIILRELPNGTIEKWKVSELTY